MPSKKQVFYKKRICKKNEQNFRVPYEHLCGLSQAKFRIEKRILAYVKCFALGLSKIDKNLSLL